MECYYHPGSVASGTCSDCGKALCKECLDTLKPPTCRECGVDFCRKKIHDAYFNLGIMAIAFCIGFYMELGSKPINLTPHPLATGILFSVALASLRIFIKFFLNTFNIAMCIILGLPGVMVLAVILAFLVVLGYIIMPILVGYFIYTIIKYKKLMQHMALGYA